MKKNTFLTGHRGPLGWGIWMLDCVIEPEGLQGSIGRRDIDGMDTRGYLGQFPVLWLSMPEDRAESQAAR